MSFGAEAGDERDGPRDADEDERRRPRAEQPAEHGPVGGLGAHLTIRCTGATSDTTTETSARVPGVTAVAGPCPVVQR